jgi:hypothetical protein
MRSIRRDNKGQVLVVSALLVALLMLSTAMYVIEINNEAPISMDDEAVFFDYRTSARNSVISGLANVSGGGASSILSEDLSTFRSVVLAHSYQAMLSMDYTLLNSGSYVDGLWLSSGTSGIGVSSAYVAFSLKSSSASASSSVDYTVNVTSRVEFSGSYVQVNDTQKSVTLNLALQNDGAAALARNFTVNYQNATTWVSVVPSVASFGDGSYRLSFDAYTGLQNEQLVVSVVCLDQRGICVGANLTCNHT